MNQNLNNKLYSKIFDISFTLYNEMKVIAESPETNHSKIYHLLADLGRVLVHSDRCSFWRRDKARKKLITAAAVGEDSIEIDEDTGIVGQAIREKRIIIDNDPYNSQYFNYTVDQETGYLTRSILVMPIIDCMGEMVGCYQAVNKLSNDGKFDMETDCRRLALAALICGLTLESDYAVMESMAKTSFLSSMSHDIRTPINAILGMNEMILRESRDYHIIHYAETIQKAGNSLLGLINNILDLSRIETAMLDIVPVEYDLASLIYEVVSMTRVQAKEKGLHFKVEYDKTTPRFLIGDEVRIKQIMTNLLTNAVKYTEKGGCTFVFGWEKIPEKEGEILLKVSVKDTGIGIRQEDMPKLFMEFRRLDVERNRKVEGSGLGMSITTNLLRLMNSELHVESVYGRGSVFSFELEQKVAMWEAIGKRRHGRGAKRHYRARFMAPGSSVLVVDDTPMNLDVFRTMLRTVLLRVDTAESGEEALKLTAARRYDLIILDQMMPGMDGVATLHALREQEGSPNGDTPVVCLTANAISGAREVYLREGFDDYLTKPISAAELEDAVLRFLPPEKIVYQEEKDDPAEGKPAGAKVPDFVMENPEIDLDKGIGLCGSAALFMETLGTYAKRIGDQVRETAEYYRRGDLENTVIRVHALKSSSRIAGAFAIGELAEKLENAGKSGDQQLLDRRLPELLERCRALGNVLRPLLGESAGSTIEELSRFASGASEGSVSGNPAGTADGKFGGAGTVASGGSASDASADLALSAAGNDGDHGLPEISPEKLKGLYDRLADCAMGSDSLGIDEVLKELSKYSLSEEERQKVDAISELADNLDFEQIPEIIAGSF